MKLEDLVGNANSNIQQNNARIQRIEQVMRDEHGKMQKQIKRLEDLLGTETLQEAVVDVKKKGREVKQEVTLPAIQILVKRPGGGSSVYTVDPLARVESLQLKICETDGIVSEMQRLLFDGKEMEPTRRLCSYGLQEFNFVDLCLRDTAKFNPYSSRADTAQQNKRSFEEEVEEMRKIHRGALTAVHKEMEEVLRRQQIQQERQQEQIEEQSLRDRRLRLEIDESCRLVREENAALRSLTSKEIGDLKQTVIMLKNSQEIGDVKKLVKKLRDKLARHHAELDEFRAVRSQGEGGKRRKGSSERTGRAERRFSHKSDESATSNT